MKHGIRALSPHALLTRSQELELTTRYAATRDPKDRNALVCANLRLVGKIANAHAKGGDTVEDLFAEGVIGLIEAIERFDPYRGFRLTTYAKEWIALRMRNWLAESAPVRNPDRKRYYSVAKRAIERGDDLAKLFGISEARAQRLRDSICLSVIPLDAPRPGAFDPLSDTLHGHDPTPEESTAERQSKAIGMSRLYAALADLTPREREVLERRLMLDEAHTLVAVGDSMGMSRERVRQIEVIAKRKLRDSLSAPADPLEASAPWTDDVSISRARARERRHAGPRRLKGERSGYHSPRRNSP